MYRHSIALALLLAAPSTHGAMADPMQVTPGTGYRIITDTDDLPEGPQTIDGCRLEPGASCPGVDLSHQDLSGMNLNGTDLSGARLVRANLHGALLKGLP
ncbi:pentapeptide repeat-containing protein [Paracoccus aerius]